jgi:hypothetical protein
VENLDAQLRKLLVATESLVFYRKALTGHTYMVSKSLGRDTNIVMEIYTGNFFIDPDLGFSSVRCCGSRLVWNDLSRLRIRIMPSK